MKRLIFLLLLLVSLPTSSPGQQATPPANTCNQPMADGVTSLNVEQGFPWQSVVTPDGCWIFVSVGSAPAGTPAKPGIAVLRRDHGKVEQRRFFEVRSTSENYSFIQNGRILAVPAPRELLFMDVEKLTSGASNPVISRVSDNRFLNPSAVAVSRDDRWLFAVQYETQWLSIVDVGGLSSSTGAKIVGGLVTGITPHQPILSPDGKYLYLPSSVGTDPSWPKVCGATVKEPEGSIQIIDVKRVVSDPSTSVVATIRAGCSTRRVAVSPDGRTIFATAGTDDSVLAFDTQPLERGLPPTLLGKVPVGVIPIGIVAVDGGKRVIVANANAQAGTPEERQNRKETLTVIDVSKISTGAGAVLGTVRAGADPRNLTVTPDGGTLLVNNALGTLDIMDLARLPLQSASKAAASSPAPRQETCNQPAVDPITDLKIDGIPRFALPSQDGCWVFLRVDDFAENRTTTRGVAVLRRDSGALRLVRYLSIPGVHDTMAFTPNQKMLLVKADRRIAVFDVEALKSGNGTPIRGYINDVHFTNTGGPQTGPLPMSRDGKYLFVSQHSLAWISIIDLQKVEAGVFGPEAVAGGFATEPFPSGIAVSHDDKYLFFVSTAPPAIVNASPKCRDYGSTSAQDPLVAPVSGLSVVELSKVLSNSASAAVSSVSTGCSTAPLSLSADGRTLYTTDRGNSKLMAFDIRPVLDGGKAPSLIGTVPVGSLASDVVVVDGGRKVIVANSNQLFSTANDRESLTVVETARIAAGGEAVLGTIRVGGDPRLLSVTQDGRTLFVSNIKSRMLQMIDLERLSPELAKP